MRKAPVEDRVFVEAKRIQIEMLREIVAGWVFTDDSVGTLPKIILHELITERNEGGSQTNLSLCCQCALRENKSTSLVITMRSIVVQFRFV